MPNTLAHLGLQLLPGVPWLKYIDIRWVALGILIPDIPWILQRVLLTLPVDLSIHEIRAYMTILSAPLFCLILALAISRLARNPNIAFLILTIHCMLHHLLDALQVKWDQGVPLLAPFSWQPYTWNLIPTEGLFIYIATLVGLALSIWLTFRKPIMKGISGLLIASPKRIATSLILVLIYFALPLLFIQKPYEYNYFNLAIWANSEARVGSTIMLDRADYIPGDPATIHNQSLPKPVVPQNLELKDKAVISLKGELMEDGALRINDYYIHHSYFRNYASILGLILIALIWIYPKIRGRI